MSAAHPTYQGMPALGAWEYERLKESIADVGVSVPIDVDEAGNTLDGHHRLRACAELGLDLDAVPRRVVATSDDTAKVRHAFVVNAIRRNMPPALLREIWRQQEQDVADMLRENATRSDREIARSTGLARPTVAKVRHRLERTAETPVVTRRGRGKPTVDSAPGTENGSAAIDATESSGENPADHRDEVEFKIVYYYNAAAPTQARTRGALPFDEAKRSREWHSHRMVLPDVHPPTDDASLVRMLNATGARLWDELHRRPMETMGP